MTSRNEQDEKFARELLLRAGPRPEIPEDDLVAIRESARHAWRDRYSMTQPGSRLRRFLLPLAAAVLGGLVLTWWMVRTPSPAPVPIVAKVERIKGAAIAVAPETDVTSALAAGQSLVAGTAIEAPLGRLPVSLALRLAGGESLRVDGGSHVVLASAEAVMLHRGAVYIDSAGGGAVTVRTPLGDFHPVGTQFEVRLDGAESAQLRVRSGQVRIARPAGALVARAGEEVIVNADGTVRRDTIRPDDLGWEWALNAAPMFEIEGRTLREFLDWIVREQAWRLEFETAQAESVSRTTVLHGSVADQKPFDALRTVTLSSGFEYELENGTLLLKQAR